jgi:uncharacterized protein YndB with AHSA1/START domain
MTEVRFERRIEHPIEKVWDAIATPGGIEGWLGRAELELKEGGDVRLQFDKTVGNVITGRVTAVAPPHVLEYTFGQEDSLLRWELRSEGEATVLRLTHTLPSPEHRAKAAAGWHTLLDMIPEAIAGNDPQWSQERWNEVHQQYV